jgi:hypothetical protein
MRYILALSLLISLCASANAATKHRRHAPVQQGFSSGSPLSARAYMPSAPPVYSQSSGGGNPYQNWGG